MKISMILASANKNAIGFKNTIPWKLPTDMKYFRSITSNNAILMGRKTFDSIGKPLKNRSNYIMTNSDTIYPGALSVKDISEVLADSENKHSELFIIGGSEIYSKFERLATTLYLTRVDANIEADAFFKISSKWKQVGESDWVKNDGDQYRMKFITYIKEQDV